MPATRNGRSNRKSSLPRCSGEKVASVCEPDERAIREHGTPRLTLRANGASTSPRKRGEVEGEERSPYSIGATIFGCFKVEASSFFGIVLFSV